MSALLLSLENAPVGALDLGALNPAALSGKSFDQMRRLRLPCGARSVALGDLFAIAGEPAEHLVLNKITACCHRIGAGLGAGTLEIHGRCGHELGREMRGGTIALRGHAGDGVGRGMRGGTITVSGNAGARLGGTVPGATRGMNEGTIIVRGSVAAHCGERMRRGVIFVGGDAGAFLGDRMIAGTIIVMGCCGTDPGLGMRRGTLLLAQPPARLPASFNSCGAFTPPFLLPLEQFLAARDKRAARAVRAFSSSERWCGDLAFGGKGELIVPASQANKP